jgi:hypothetical protein
MRLLKNKKGVVWWILAKLAHVAVFVLIVMLYLGLFTLVKQQVSERVKNDFGTPEMNLIINNLLYQTVRYEGKSMTMADLLIEHYGDGEIAGKLDSKRSAFINDYFKNNLIAMLGKETEWQMRISIMSDDPNFWYDALSMPAIKNKYVVIGSTISTDDSNRHLQYLPTPNKNTIVIEYWPPT